MSIGIELILTTTLAATPPACSWAHPGADPYRGDPVAVLADFDLPAATRDQLRVAMRAHRPTDVATITRDDIVGRDGGYTDLREMHSGHGRVCHGAVDRSAWSERRRERALVYCADDACVIVPAICHNVSLVSRKPGHAAQDDGPIDIEPAAGPPRSPAPSTTSPPDAGPPGFLPPPEGAGAPPDMPITGLPPGGGGGDVGPPGGLSPIGSPPGGGLPCCESPPGLPVGPGTPPVITPVPESPTWLLLLAGLAALRPWRRRDAAQTRTDKP
jgi:MYXO-CTERM domain-containing protein